MPPYAQENEQILDDEEILTVLTKIDEEPSIFEDDDDESSSVEPRPKGILRRSKYGVVAMPSHWPDCSDDDDDSDAHADAAEHSQDQDANATTSNNNNAQHPLQQQPHRVHWPSPILTFTHYRPYTPPQDQPLLFYSPEDIETFKKQVRSIMRARERRAQELKDSLVKAREDRERREIEAMERELCVYRNEKEEGEEEVGAVVGEALSSSSCSCETASTSSTSSSSSDSSSSSSSSSNNTNNEEEEESTEEKPATRPSNHSWRNKVARRLSTTTSVSSTASSEEISKLTAMTHMTKSQIITKSSSVGKRRPSVESFENLYEQWGGSVLSPYDDAFYDEDEEEEKELSLDESKQVEPVETNENESSTTNSDSSSESSSSSSGSFFSSIFVSIWSTPAQDTASTTPVEAAPSAAAPAEVVVTESQEEQRQQPPPPCCPSTHHLVDTMYLF